MKILLFLIPSLVILFSCTKDKTPPKDECIEPYVGDYKVIELRKDDGTIIPENKVRDSLQADHAWIERKATSADNQNGWYYFFYWSAKTNPTANTNNQVLRINSCNTTITAIAPSANSSSSLLNEMTPPKCIVKIEKFNNTYLISNNFNSAYLKLIKL